jgi:REP element-mobilizing transposase RayT
MVGKYNPEIHSRRTIRLRDYDYSSPGAYFVTICTKRRENLFGEIIHGNMRLSEAGEIIQAVWDALPKRYPSIALDISVIMPNHVHGIIVLTDATDVGAGQALPGSEGAASSAPTLGDVIRTFKSISAIQVSSVLGRTGQPLWQRNYYEHIIRNETSLARIREYIASNPQNWILDRQNPANLAATSDFEEEL